MKQEGIRERANYRSILDKFGASEKANRDAVQHLEGLGFRKGQARSAVYQYRKERGLVHPRRAKEVPPE